MHRAVGHVVSAPISGSFRAARPQVGHVLSDLPPQSACHQLRRRRTGTIEWLIDQPAAAAATAPAHTTAASACWNVTTSPRISSSDRVGVHPTAASIFEISG